ncbi:group II intron maturase-specific domain-containing protein [Caballeronia sordidicola]
MRAPKQANLFGLLNLVLRGWANYHNHVVAKETFTRVDADVWSMLGKGR